MWVPFSASIQENGEVRIGGKVISRSVIQEISINDQSQDKHVTMHVPSKLVTFESSDKWCYIRDENNKLVLRIKNAAYLAQRQDPLFGDDYVIVNADAESLLWVGNGLEVILNLFDEVE